MHVLTPAERERRAASWTAVISGTLALMDVAVILLFTATLLLASQRGLITASEQRSLDLARTIVLLLIPLFLMSSFTWAWVRARHPRARTLGLAAALLHLPLLPFGTVLGALLLWRLPPRSWTWQARAATAR